MAPSARNLLLSNAATLVAALALGWNVGWLLWAYWIQSVIVGYYARLRMLSLREFSTEGFTSGGQRVPETEAGKRSTAHFFVLHYGFFHLGYLAFLFAQHRVSGAFDWLVLVACGVSFALSQRKTFDVQHAADLRGRPSLGALMFTPYLRVLPMHLTILFGASGQGTAALLVFCALKTASDLGLDAIDRRMAERSAAKRPATVTRGEE
ncbi:MAG: hypothetical protein HOQ32_18375 [Lysobacter sp.]|nr:hypothetical protein [Lysobacter sp.]